MIYPFGNRCGHRRDDPRLRLVFEPKKKRPPKVREMQSRSERLSYRRRSLLRRFGICARSELAEAIVLVVKALLLEWDQVTSRVGWARGDGRLVGVPLEVLARWTGLNFGRVVRAVGVLRHAGLLQGGQPVEHKNGRWIGYAAVRRISWRLFYLLGYTENDMRQIAENAQKRRQQAAAPAPPPDKGPPESEPTAAGDVLARLEGYRARQLARLAPGEPPDG